MSYIAPNGKIYTAIKEMAKDYNINYSTLRDRLKQGWNLDMALLKIPKEHKKKLSIDHLGNCYQSEAEMCRLYNISVQTFNRRIQLGWSLEKALTKKLTKNYIFDHLGNKYNSIQDMCEAYSVPRYIYDKRIKNGLSIEQALKPYKKWCVVIYGKTYYSRQEICDKFNISIPTLKRLLYQNINIEEYIENNDFSISAIERKMLDYFKNKNIEIIHDTPLKNIFDNVPSEMKNKRFDAIIRNYKDCDIYIETDGTQHFKPKFSEKEYINTVKNDIQKNDYVHNKPNSILIRIRYDQIDKIEYILDNVLLNPRQFNNRFNLFLSNEEYYSIRKNYNIDKCSHKYIYDHLGNKYYSLTDMCKTYGISRQTFKNRLNIGMTLEEALTQKPQYKRTIRCIELNTIYPSVIKASKELHISHSTISNNLLKKYNQAGGYHFEYV